MPEDNDEDLNECPKCKALSATTETLQDGSSRFYCTQAICDFEIIQKKQSFDKALKKLQEAKQQLFKK